MKSSMHLLALCVALLRVPAAVGELPAAVEVQPETPSTVSTSLPEMPRPAGSGALTGGGHGEGTDRVAAFSTIGIGVKVGVGGIGFDVATPVASRLNLRVGGSFFTYNINNLVEDGFNINGSIQLRSVNTSVDIFPFGGSFRISPGVTLYNGNNFGGNATVPGAVR